MCGEDSHLESDYEDRYGTTDYLGDSDYWSEGDPYEDGMYESDEEDEEDDSPIGVATFETDELLV